MNTQHCVEAYLPIYYGHINVRYKTFYIPYVATMRTVTCQSVALMAVYCHLVACFDTITRSPAVKGSEEIKQSWRGKRENQRWEQQPFVFDCVVFLKSILTHILFLGFYVVRHQCTPPHEIKTLPMLSHTGNTLGFSWVCPNTHGFVNQPFVI